MALPGHVCTEGLAYDPIYITAGNNGVQYQVCLHYVLKDKVGGKYKVYDYPDKVLVKNGYLLKRPGVGIFYDFVSTVIDTMPPHPGPSHPGGDGGTTSLPSDDGNQIIAGIDNTVLIIAGIAIFLMMKN